MEKTTHAKVSTCNATYGRDISSKVGSETLENIFDSKRSKLIRASKW